VATAGAAAADYGRVVVALHRVGHVNEAGFVALSQSFEGFIERDFVRVVFGELCHVILGWFQV